MQGCAQACHRCLVAWCLPHTLAVLNFPACSLAALCRTIREDIDKKRLEKQLGTQEAAKPPARPAAAEEPAGPNLAIGAALAILIPAIGFWLLTK